MRTQSLKTQLSGMRPAYVRPSRLGWAVALALATILAAGTMPASSTPIALSRNTLTVSFTTISPLFALIAGILILIVPRLLNYIVAAYLILIGAVGLFAR